jgi:cellulose synthase (UDP-forming)
MLVATVPVAPPPSANTPPAPNTLPSTGQPAIIPHTENNGLLESVVTLPANLLAHSNDLTFEFIGHYATKCEDPSHSALWSHIDNNSTIEFAGSLLPLRDDLKQLPAPFYDSAVNLHPVIPIVFLTQPSQKALQAAGIVASWFGIAADSRPIRFPVSIGTIPAGNAIVIDENGENNSTSLRLNPISTPTIAIQQNPSDPYSKILVLAGTSADDVLTAATALSLQRDLLEGAMVTVPTIKMPAPRTPDDAPRWLSTDKATPIGDIAQTSSFDSDGSNPVAVYLRLPPDLYYGAKRNLGFHLGYRYNGIPISNDSTLQVSLNGSYISSNPLPHTDKASAELESIVPVPVSNLRPFSNSMLMQFVFRLSQKGDCPDTIPDNLRGSILKDSYLDIQGIPHSAIMPNLEIFANAGYPFTRMADLADTAVVLPDTATPEEIEIFLTFMGHFGAQTGYPVLNVSVTNSDG